MEAMLSTYLSNPLYAAGFAMIVVVLYIHMKQQLNHEPKPNTSDYTKPAILVGILVYFIVHMIMYGHGDNAQVLREPFN